MVLRDKPVNIGKRGRAIKCRQLISLIFIE